MAPSSQEGHALLTMDSRGRDCSTDTSCILDGEENDACEVLHLLANIITDELHDHFREHQSVALSSQAALQDILSLSWSCSSSKTADSVSSIDTRDRSVTAEIRDECRSPRQNPKVPSGGKTLQHGTTESAKHEDALYHPDMSAAEVPLQKGYSTSVNTCTGDSISQERASGVSNARASKGASPAHVRVHAAEQAEPTLAAWKACRSPMELSQAQEIACLVCRRLTSTTVSSAVALPLILPAVKVSMRDISAKSLCGSEVLLCKSTLCISRKRTVTAAETVDNAEGLRMCQSSFEEGSLYLDLTHDNRHMSCS